MNATNRMLDAAIEALQNSDDVALEELLRDGFDPNSRAKRQADNQTYPVLFIAATNHRGNTCLEKLLAAGADPNAVGRASLIFNKSFYEQSAMTALMVAACEKGPRCVKALLIAGADIGLQNTDGETALSLARKAGGKQIIKLLEDAADELGAEHNDLTLHQAVCSGQIEVIDKLLALGIDVNEADESGRTALMHAILQDNATVLMKLLGVGADPAVAWPRKGDSTWNRVMKQRSAVKLAAALLASVSDPATLVNASDDAGDEVVWLWSNAFAMERKGEAAAVTKLLLDAGLDPNERLPNGMTPLLLAAARTVPKSVDAISVLVSAGAKIDAMTGPNTSGNRRRETELAKMEADGRDVSALRARTHEHKPLSLFEVAKANSRKVYAAVCDLFQRDHDHDEYDTAGVSLNEFEDAVKGKSFVALKESLSTALQSQPKAWNRQSGAIQFAVKLKILLASSSDESRENDDVDMRWLEPVQRQAAEVGASLVYHGQPTDPAETADLLLVPTRSWSAVLRICGTNGDNYGLSTCDIINRLAEFQDTWPFELQGCGHDFAAIRFQPIEGHQLLHRALLEFCPDLEGEDSTSEELGDFYRNDGRCFLWWD